jgi:hypothetical protein
MTGIRVLHCPANVGGNPYGLASAERRLGLCSKMITFERSPFGYPSDEVLFNDRDSFFRWEMKRWRFLWRALRDFDILHFNFGRSIAPFWVPMSAMVEWLRSSPHHGHSFLIPEAASFYIRLFELRDLPLLKKCGKGIVVTYQGDDARQGDFCLENFEISAAGEVEPGYYSRESDMRKRHRIARFAQYADRIYALNPDLLHVLPSQAQFLPYSHIDLRDWMPVHKSNGDSKVPVVVHAPSHRGTKGTRFVLDAISQLKAEGVAVKFLLVEGMTHTQARRMYEEADLVIDQLLAGWYGGVAVEAMALGKPVICYIREGDLGFIPQQMRQDLPIIRATPGNIYDVLREWLTARRHELREVGSRSRAYVERWHDPLNIAATLKIAYEEIMASKQ